VLLLRILLPDRPGSLGQVATAMGQAGADISAIEIVEKRPDGSVIDDFMLTMPPNSLVETLVSACTALEGVEVQWLSRYPDTWGIESDLEVLDEIAAHPRRAQRTLAMHAPRVFHCQWATIVDTINGIQLHATEHAPELPVDKVKTLAPLNKLHRQAVGEDWLEGWGEMALAVAPLKKGRVLILGRQGGPEFLDSELLRLRHLSGIAS
jgi:hypothetical protein